MTSLENLVKFLHRMMFIGVIQARCGRTTEWLSSLSWLKHNTTLCLRTFRIDVYSSGDMSVMTSYQGNRTVLGLMLPKPANTISCYKEAGKGSTTEREYVQCKSSCV